MVSRRATEATGHDGPTGAVGRVQQLSGFL